MSTPEFLTPQELAKTLKISTYTAYELIKRGEIGAVRVGRQLRVPRHELERYVGLESDETGPGQSTMPSLKSDQAKQTPARLGEGAHVLRIVGSHDPALDLLVSEARKRVSNLRITTSYTGSLEGLMSLFHGEGTIAAAHLWAEEGSGREQYLRHVLPNHQLTVVRLCVREVGLVVAAGNPAGIRSLTDLARENVRFINRQPGSGTRVRFDRLLQKAGLRPSDIQGYDDELDTHHGVAMAVGSGSVDAGVACRSATSAAGLDFVRLYREPYDLVLNTSAAGRPSVSAFLEVLSSAEYLERLSRLEGYELDQAGKQWQLET